MVAHYPLADTFKLQSRPTATKTIYLNFTGHVTTGTYWNDSGDITTKPYSFEGDATFSNNELNQIQEIWDRVSECFSPFDVNVTTQEPPASDLVNSGGSDTRWGIRVCIGESNPSPAPGAGGVAYVGSFSWSTDTPCFVFESGPGVYGKYIADATVHEVGHTLDLEHDGRISPPEEYYEGHGSGPTGWAPHMGVSYYQNLVQWSKGEYLSANNTEDDLAIISTHNGFGYRPDDFASSQGTAADIGGAAAGSVFNVRQNGVIEQRTDSDWFKITAAAGALNLNAVGGPRNTMLDIKLDLYDANGSLLVSNNPTADVVASISYTVPTGGGTYYVKIDGTGVGDPLATGYTDYSSLGQYRITGTYTTDGNPPPTNDVVAAYNVTTKTLTLTGDAGANSVTVTYQSGLITVKGASGTTVNSKTTDYTVSVPLQISMTVDTQGGNDTVVVTGARVKTMTVSLGDGNDTLRLNYCTVSFLSLNGGSGIDAYTTISSRVTRKTVTGVP